MEWRSIFRRRMDECWRRFFPALRSLSGSHQRAVKSGLAVAKARGKRLGRQAGVRPKSDRLLPKVVAMRAEGRSYRWIARELGISKNTVADIVQRHRANVRVSFRPQPEPTLSHANWRSGR